MAMMPTNTGPLPPARRKPPVLDTAPPEIGTDRMPPRQMRPPVPAAPVLGGSEPPQRSDVAPPTMRKYHSGVPDMSRPHRAKNMMRGMTTDDAANALSRRRWRGAVALLLALFVSSASAQQLKGEFVSKYDLDATSYTYCNRIGTGESAFRGPIRVDIPIKTTGSSTTVEAVTAATGPFTTVAVGDILSVPTSSGTTDLRWVRTRADADTVTVDTAIDWSSGPAAVGFSYWDVTCGTASTNGWIPVDAAKGGGVNVQWQVDQLNVTGGIDVRVECRDATTVPVATTVYPDPADSTSTNECKKGNLTTVNSCKLLVLGTWDQCRIGFKIGTNDNAGIVITETTDDLDFTEDAAGTPKVCRAVVAAATYSTGSSACVAVAAAMNTAGICGGATNPDNTYACSYSSTTGKITISRSAGTKTIDLNWATGANTATSAKTALGYANSDDTGATSYVGDNVVDTDEATNTENISAFVKLEVPR